MTSFRCSSPTKQSTRPFNILSFVAFASLLSSIMEVLSYSNRTHFTDIYSPILSSIDQDTRSTIACCFFIVVLTNIVTSCDVFLIRQEKHHVLVPWVVSLTIALVLNIGCILFTVLITTNLDILKDHQDTLWRIRIVEFYIAVQVFLVIIRACCLLYAKNTLKKIQQKKDDGDDLMIV